MIPLGLYGAAHVPAAGGGPTVEYVSSSTNETSSVFDIGAFSANRKVLVGIHATSGGAPTGVLADGSAIGTPVHSLTDGPTYSALHVLTPSGTTLTVASSVALVKSVWVVRGTLTYSTSGGDGAPNPSVTLTAPSNCLCIGVYSSSNTSTIVGTSFTGITQRHLATFGNPWVAAGDGTPTAGSHTVTMPGGVNFYNALSVTDFSLT